MSTQSPTSTSSSSSSSPSATSNGPGLRGVAAIFGTSDPLVPAGLIVSLLAVVMLGIMVWNRMVHRRSIAARAAFFAAHPNLRLQEGLGFGERPKLWDVWIAERDEEERRKWSDMLPLSASLSPHSLDTPRDRSTLSANGNGNASTSTPASYLQLAVVIAMPSLHPPPYDQDDGKGKLPYSVLLPQQDSEYYIGLTDVPLVNQT